MKVEHDEVWQKWNERDRWTFGFTVNEREINTQLNNSALELEPVILDTVKLFRRGMSMMPTGSNTVQQWRRKAQTGDIWGTHHKIHRYLAKALKMSMKRKISTVATGLYRCLWFINAQMQAVTRNLANANRLCISISSSFSKSLFCTAACVFCTNFIIRGRAAAHRACNVACHGQGQLRWPVQPHLGSPYVLHQYRWWSFFTTLITLT